MPALEQQSVNVSAVKKNQKELIDLYDQYSGALYGEITRIVRSAEEADEIFIDVFVTICKRFHEYDPSKSRLFTWMISIVRTKCVDHLKKERVVSS